MEFYEKNVNKYYSWSFSDGSYNNDNQLNTIQERLKKASDARNLEVTTGKVKLVGKMKSLLNFPMIYIKTHNRKVR